MDITIGGTPFIKKDPPEEKMTLRQKSIKLLRRDQRKNLQDRRKSVRDGIIVSLSYKKDRRKQQDRRSYH